MAKDATADDLVKEARELLQEDFQADRDNRIEAQKDFEFRAGQQWPSTVAREREANNRPTLTINRLPQFINQVVNDFRINVPAFKVIPVDGEADEELSEIYNGLIRTIAYASNATHVWTSSFDHAVSCGMGNFRIDTKYASDEDFDQEICIKRITDPFSVYWDAGAREIDRTDANHCFVTELITKRAFNERFKGAAETSFDKPDVNWTNGSAFFWNTQDAIRVAEYWRKVPKKKKIIRFQDGTIVDASTIRKELLVFMPPVHGEREVDSWQIEHCLVSGSEVLEKTTTWPGKYIPIVPVIGTEIPLGDYVWRGGLIRHARDPQQLYNFWRSAAAESIALAPRAPFLTTANMIAKFKDQWDSHHLKNRPYLLYEPDPDVPGGRPVREPPPDIPAALLQESAIASDDMKATTGIYDAALGQRSNEQSGRAIVARQREGDVSTYHYRDNFNVALTHCGRIIVDLIPHIYDTERVVRLMDDGDEPPKFAKVNQTVMSDNGAPMMKNDLRAGKFDIMVSIGPSYTTRRQESADSMIQFIQAFPAAGQVTGDLVAKSMDWPDADKFAERLKRTIPPQILGEDAEQPDPQAQQMQQRQQQIAETAMALEMESKRLANAKTEAETHDKHASAAEREMKILIEALQFGLQPPQPVMQQPSSQGAPLPSAGAPSLPSSGAPAQPEIDPEALAALRQQDQMMAPVM